MEYPYRVEAEKMKSNERVTMNIDFSHLIQFKTDIDLAYEIIEHFYRFEQALKHAVRDFMTTYYPEYAQKHIFYVAFHNMSDLGQYAHLATTP